MGRKMIDVYDPGSSLDHEKRRFFDDIVSHVNDQVGAINGAVKVVFVRECGSTQKAGMAFIHYPFAHLGVETEYPGLVDKFCQSFTGAVSVGSGTNEQKGLFCRANHFHRSVKCFVIRAWSSGGNGFEGGGRTLFGGDILRQFQMNCAWPFFPGNAHGFMDQHRYIISMHNLFGEFGERFHHFHYVEDLETPLFAFLNGFLAGYHENGHGPQLCVSPCRHKISHTRTQCGKANSNFSGQPAIGCGYEACGLLVSGQNQLNFGTS